jgi:phosphate transport system permease protein
MPSSEITSSSVLPDFQSVRAIRYRRWRHIQDFLTRYLMAFGGVGVIIAILLIAFYLLYVVLPLFFPAHMELIDRYTIPGDAAVETRYLSIEEQTEIGTRMTADGKVLFFKASDGSVISQFNVLEKASAAPASFNHGDAAQAVFAYGLENGAAVVGRHVYLESFPEGNRRVITPSISYPSGAEPIILDPQGRTIRHVAAESDGDNTTIVGVTDDNQVFLASISAEKAFLSDEVEIKQATAVIDYSGAPVTHILLDKEQREVFIAGKDGVVSYYNIADKEDPVLVHKARVVPENASITAFKLLSGGISILVGNSRGQIAQWFPVRDDANNYTLQFVRGFEEQEAPITAIAPEYFRKGFIAADSSGSVGIYHTTAHKLVYKKKLADAELRHVAISPREDALLVQNSENQIEFWEVENEHPEVSWNSLWGKVWYESRQEPEYIWQSSSAASEFEPKFSLTPLAFGTLKAAFYAMLFSVPLAIFGAMYTAYFMSPRMRGYVKPTVEIMEALPTVILGFLAGLWLAPYVEKHLPGIFLMLLFMPVSVLIAAWIWHHLPASIRNRVDDGWEAALLMPVIAFAVWFSMQLSAPVESMFFGGNMPLWLTNEMGINYEQRNSLVVGLAMGLAVIPNIFSIAEDAIFSVPKHLTTGSLALGATRWQTMMRVVLLTASPGIFSAVMIGLGRAVGETMIVVMATGNTAIMDLNIFQGFRALSANIAVEMPETEVNSTHYRILFLAALVLFMATFLVNTIAEVVRQRLRNKYSSL